MNLEHVYTTVLEQIIAKIGELSGHNRRLCYEKISLHKIMGIFRTFLRKSKIAIARMRMTMGVAPLSYLWAHDRGFPIHRYYVEIFLKAWTAEYSRSLPGVSRRFLHFTFWREGGAEARHSPSRCTKSSCDSGCRFDPTQHLAISDLRLYHLAPMYCT